MNRTILLLLLAITMAVPAGADAMCTTSKPEVDTGPTPMGQYYVDRDPCWWCTIEPIWIYEESNGLDGLQRGDEIKDDTNGGACYPSDEIIF